MELEKEKNMTAAEAKTAARYKPSRYNLFFPAEDGNYLAYNAFSNSFAKITARNYERITEILAAPNNPWFTSEEHSKLARDLIASGYLIDSTFNEFEILKAQNRIGRFGNGLLALTIAPTLRCPCRCFYCFEHPKSESMSPQVEEALIKFVDKRLAKMNGLHVSWFGGEPLLEIDMIERLSKAFKEICTKHNVPFNPGNIISNGLLLSTSAAERLKNAGIDTVQVTFDGPPAIHDQRRTLKGGGGTFWRIFNNVKAAAHILKIIIRINIDKDNVEGVQQFFEICKEQGLLDRAIFYFGQVRADTAACADIAGQCFVTKDFSRLTVDLLLKAQNIGLSNIRYPHLIKSGFCTADNINGFVVAPSGNLFKCWEEISEDVDKSIGNLLSNEQIPLQLMNTARYLNWDPFYNGECKACDILPICAGGCVFKGLNSVENKDCMFWKFNLNDMLALKYKELTKTIKKGG